MCGGRGKVGIALGHVLTLRTGYWLGGLPKKAEGGIRTHAHAVDARPRAPCILRTALPSAVDFGMVHERSRGTLSLLEQFMRELSEIGRCH